MTDPPVLLDVNVLLAMANEHHVHHGAAHAWFTGVQRWATTPLTESAFVRLQSNPTVTGQDTSCAAALAALVAMRQHPGHVFLPDDASLAAPLIETVGLVGHRQVTDLHLVNLCAAAGCFLATFDAKIAAALAPSDRGLIRLVPA
jgi:toxin-antitoxin system PIN domain toxin